MIIDVSSMNWYRTSRITPRFTKTVGSAENPLRQSDYVICKYDNKLHHADNIKDMAYRILRYEKRSEKATKGLWYCPIEQRHVMAPDQWAAFIN